MKVIFTICAFFLAIFSFGQTNFRVGLTGVNGADEYGFNDLVQMNDGNYICVGSNYVEADNTEGMSIAKFNAQGQLLISKSLVPSSFDEDVEGIAIIKTADGGIAVSGNINDTICLLKFDANLTLSWHKQLVSDSENFSYGTRLIQTSDGGYMVAGSINKVNNDDYEYGAGTVIKTNSNGDVLWAKQYFDFPGETSEEFRDINDIIATKDGNYLLLVDAYSYNNSDEYDSTYLVKINAGGTVLWSKFVTSDLLDETPISIISTSDGGYLICGYAFPQAMLIKLNQDGNVVWSRANEASSTYRTDLAEVKEDKDGGFICAGEFDSTDIDGNYIERSYFFKVNSSGTLLWTKIISSNATYEYPFSLTFTGDDGFAAAGRSSLYNGDDNTLNFDRGIFYKFGSDYNICGGTSSSGILTDIHAATSAKAVAVHDLNTSALSTTLTITTAGSGVNLCSTLPLQLLSFNATLQNKSVTIEWKTANEVNTDYFTVERSSNGTAFTALQKVAAEGNSSNVQTYTTTDLQPLFGTSYYRLKQVDKDGKATYSNTVPVTVSANGTIAISPNPVRDNIRILLQSKENSSLSFRIMDMTGKILAVQTANVNTGTNTILIPAASLSKGLYVLKITGSNTTQSIKFMKE